MGKKYIIPLVKVSGKHEEESLTDALINFLHHPTQQILLIQGSAKIGKSTALSYIKNYLIQQAITTQLIRLNRFSALDFFDDKKQLLNTNLKKKKHWTKKSQRKRVLLLDGLDKLNGKNGLINIHQTNQLHNWENLKVIITCRQEILPANYQRFFQPIEGDYIEWQLLPFNYEQQYRYIAQLLTKYHARNQYSQLTHELCMQFLTELPEDLLGNPFLLGFCFKGFSFLFEQTKQGSSQILNSSTFLPELFSLEIASIHSSSPYSSTNPLKTGLKNESQLTALLKSYCAGNFILGKAQTQGDCFFDALAQSLNHINYTQINTDKYLRMLCHNYYEKNKALVDQWNSKDYGGIEKYDDYFMVQYTAQDCQERLHNRNPIWGRPAVEGIILCNYLNFNGLCIIEILENPETMLPVVSFHWVNKETYSNISEQKGKNCLQNFQIPVLVVEQHSLHFVPLIRFKPTLLPSSYLVNRLSNNFSEQPIKNNVQPKFVHTPPPTYYQIYAAAFTQHFMGTTEEKPIVTNQLLSKLVAEQEKEIESSAAIYISVPDDWSALSAKQLSSALALDKNSNLVSYHLVYAQELAVLMWANRSKLFPINKWSINLFPQTLKLLSSKTETEKQILLLKGHHHCLLNTKKIMNVSPTTLNIPLFKNI